MVRYISPGKVFAHLDRLAAWKAGDRPAPVTLEWDLCNRCSLGCEQCHFAHTHSLGPWAGRAVLPLAYQGTGDLADTAVVMRALAEAHEAGVRGVVWSGGGEPTLHPRWPEIVAYGKACGLQQGMYTLGGHLDAGKAAVLARSADWVVVSLDAADARSYAEEKRVGRERFSTACSGVSLLAERGEAVVGVSFLLHAGNWRRADEMLALGRGLGADYVTFRPRIETSVLDPSRVDNASLGWVAEALPDISRLANEPDVEADPRRFVVYGSWDTHGYGVCYGVRLAATITPDGRVWVCPQRRGIEGSCVGDLRRMSFGDIWARHPGRYDVDKGCRAMCRYHLMNEQLADVFAEGRRHVEFV